jgi:hypothetical protein
VRTLEGLVVAVALTAIGRSVAAQTPAPEPRGAPPTAPAGHARARVSPKVTTAFYYGARVPRELTQHFDRVIVDVDNLAAWPAPCKAELFAYVSLGEVGAGRPWRRSVPDGVIVARNAEWGSEIVDVRRPAWRTFVLEQIVPGVLKRGIRGLFFDTLDSFESVEHAESHWPSHQRALAELIDAIRASHPELKVLLNRGFGILPYLVKPPDGVVVESLFRTADAAGKHYRPVPTGETEQLLRALRGLRDTANIPVTVIDYVPPTEVELRRTTARRIMSEGFEPYLSVPSLDQIGMGRIEPVRRRVLLVYRSQIGAENLAPPMDASLAAPILEWQGYAVDYVDVRRGLPAPPLVDRYAGAVVLGTEELGSAYAAWIEARIREGLRVAFLSSLGYTPNAAFLTYLGLERAATRADPPLVATHTSPSVGFETTIRPLLYDLPPYVATGARTHSLLRLGDQGGHIWDAIVVGPWGGAVFAPYLASPNLDGERRWIVNPFAFLREALAMASIPAPDVTTETGRRILTIHIDGDGFPSRAEFGDHAFAGQVVLNELLLKNDVPHTVSVIEGEVGPGGLYPADAPRLEEIARTIFRLPHVEAASHTYSHPFTWADAETHRPASSPAMLPLPGYVFDARREVTGSLDYLRTRLLPAGKAPRVLLWSGDCSPSPELVALTEAAGVENVNGAGATLTADRPTLTLASPLGMNKGSGFQVFAPVQNENVFTNDWHGPFYGYEHVIETFELTETPRRLGPLSIYYHFFSGTKTASLVALRKVYKWALGRDTTKLFLSEYAEKVQAFHQATLTRRLEDDAWDLGDLGALRTVRLDEGLWPVLDASVGVAGVRPGPSGRYVHLASDESPVLVLGSRPSTGPYLLDANGGVLSWKRESGGIRLRVRGHEPLRIAIAGATTCALRMRARVARARGDGQVVRFSLPEHDTGEATLDCD